MTKIPPIFFSGAMIVPSSKYNISDDVISDYQFVSTLLIKSLNKNDFAQYVCVAKNTIGKSEETIKIYGEAFNHIASVANYYIFSLFSEIEREIVPTIPITTQTYLYEEYHTQVTYQPNKEETQRKHINKRYVETDA